MQIEISFSSSSEFMRNVSSSNLKWILFTVTCSQGFWVGAWVGGKWDTSSQTNKNGNVVLINGSKIGKIGVRWWEVWHFLPNQLKSQCFTSEWVKNWQNRGGMRSKKVNLLDPDICLGVHKYPSTIILAMSLTTWYRPVKKKKKNQFKNEMPSQIFETKNWECLYWYHTVMTACNNIKQLWEKFLEIHAVFWAPTVLICSCGWPFWL